MKTNKKINQHQLQFLYEFCKKKDIQFIELRIEFVDHLAELIEKKWKEKPHLDFKQDFHEVYKTFGVFGFREIAEQHNSIAQKNYWKSVKSELLKIIQIPNLLVVILFYVLIYSILIQFPGLSKYFWIAIYASLISVFVFFTIQTKKLNKKLKQDTSMYLQITQQFFWVMYLVVISPNINFLFDNQEIVGVENDLPILFTSLVFFVVSLFIWINFKLLAWAKAHIDTLVARRFVW